MTDTSTIVYHAPDIECGGCGKSIQNALGRIAGIHNIAIDIDTKMVTVQYDPQTVTEEVVLLVLDKAGFPATPCAQPVK